MAASWPLIVVEVFVKPKKPCKVMEKLIVPPATLVNVEFLLVLAKENVGWNDSKKNVPAGQFTVTLDVAVSVPVTCEMVPKFMSVTFSAQPETTVRLTFMLVDWLAA